MRERERRREREDAREREKTRERERERGCYHIKLDVTLADSVCQILNFGVEPDSVPRNMSYSVHSDFSGDWPRFTAQTTYVFTLLVLGCTLQLHIHNPN